MDNSKLIDQYLEENGDRFLPIVGRSLFVEISKYCINGIVATSALTPELQPLVKKLDAARRTGDSDEGINALLELPGALDQVLGWFSNFLIELKSAGEKSSISLESINHNLATNMGTYKKPMSSFAEPIEKVFSALPESEFIQTSISSNDAKADMIAHEAKFDLAALIHLCMSIIHFKISENRFLERFENDYSKVSEELSPSLSSIVDLYISMKLSKPVRQLVNDKYSSGISRQAGGKKSKVEKQPLFDGFIEWALKLPENHTFRFCKHAAEYYIDHILKNEQPELYRLVSSTTPRTMASKLKEHCKANNIKLPIRS